jgi:hypothetical protein
LLYTISFTVVPYSAHTIIQHNQVSRQSSLEGGDSHFSKWGSQFHQGATSFPKVGSQKFAYKFTFKPLRLFLLMSCCILLNRLSAANV